MEKIHRLNFEIILPNYQCKAYATCCRIRSEQVKKLSRDPDWSQEDDRLVSRHISYNVFDFPEFKYLKKIILNNIPTRFKSSGYGIKGWINYLYPGEELRRHCHDYDLSGHLTLQSTHSKTIYEFQNETVSIKSPEGALHLFKKETYHEVTKNNSTKPRISIAFDLIKYSEISPEFSYLLQEI